MGTSTFWPAPGRFELASRCGFPWSPHAPRWPKREWSDNAARGFGEAFGLAIEAVAILGCSAEASAREAAEHKALTAADRQRLVICVEKAAATLNDQATYRSVETALLYHPASDRAWQVEREESYRPISGHLGSVLDMVEIVDGRVEVTDWKTGYAQARNEDIRDSWQLRAYGLFAARAFHVDEATVRLRHVSEDGVRSDPMVLDPLELGTIQSEITGLLAWLGAAQPPNPGRHCTGNYCPLLTVCPVTSKRLLEIQRSTDAATTRPLTPNIEGPEHAAQVRRGLVMAEKALGPIKAALHAWVEKHGGFEIEPGVWYGPVVHEGKRRVDIEVPGAMDVIREHLGDDADVALTFETSAAALKRAARERARRAGDTDRGAEGRVYKPLSEALANIGAVKQGAPYTTIEEKKIRRGKGGEETIDTTGESVEPEAAE